MSVVNIYVRIDHYKYMCVFCNKFVINKFHTSFMLLYIMKIFLEIHARMKVVITATLLRLLGIVFDLHSCDQNTSAHHSVVINLKHNRTFSMQLLILATPNFGQSALRERHSSN